MQLRTAILKMSEKVRNIILVQQGIDGHQIYLDVICLD